MRSEGDSAAVEGENGLTGWFVEAVLGNPEGLTGHGGSTATNSCTYTSSPSGSGIGLPSVQDRSSYAMTMYSARGTAWRTAMAIDPTDVDPEAGAGILVEQRWYDGRGQTVGRIAPGQPMQKTTFDGLGRPETMYSVAASYQTFSDIYDADNFVAEVSSDRVVEEREYTYQDETGLLEIVTQRMRTHDTPDSVTGALSNVGEPRNVITSYQGSRYDSAGRALEQINFGTNHHSGDEFRYGGVLPDLDQFDPSDALVTTTRYDEIGRVDAVIDPEGIETGFRYDSLNRRIAMVENQVENQVGPVELDWLEVNHLDPDDVDRWEVTSGLNSNHLDQNRVTSYVYDGASNVIKQVAHMPPSTGSGEVVQVTEYVHGVVYDDNDPGDPAGSALNSNDLLLKVIYPEGDASTTLETRSVTMSYNRLGEVTRMQDQNGTVHEYAYDKMGRRTTNRVTEFGSDIDEETNYHGTIYGTRGMVQEVRTGYSSGGGGGLPPLVSLQSAVRFLYDDMGQLEHMDQSHSGSFPFGAGGPEYRMTWSYDQKPFDPTGTDPHNYSRVEEIAYPFGGDETDHVAYGYGESGSIDDILSRVRAIGAGGLTDAVEYHYLGLSRHVVADYLEPDVQLDRTARADGERTLFDQDGTAGHYPAFDRFGRVVAHRWVDGAFKPYDPVESLHSLPDKPHVPPIYELVHSYDRASNRLTRSNTTASLSWDHRDEIFEYDGLHRLERAYAGYRDDLNVFQESEVASKPSMQWGLDSLGNWKQVDQLAWAPPNQLHTDPATCLHEARGSSDANELVSRGMAYTGNCDANWVGPLPLPSVAQSYDAAGNMVTNETVENPFSSASYPQVGLVTVEYRYVWDAWNRLVRIDKKDEYDDWNEISSYRYNALNWRISKTAVQPDPSESFTQTRRMYYNPSWQLVLERIDDEVDGSFELDRQIAYYWGNRYIDDIFLRRQHDFPEEPDPLDPEPAPDPVMTDWYHITDTLFSTVAVLSQRGGVLERVSYDAYGRAQRHRPGDLTGNGIAESADLNLVNDGNNANNGQGEYGIGDITRTGVVDDNDVAIVQRSQGLGWYSQSGMLSTHGPAGGTDNILGYAGYIFNAEIAGAGLYTVRFRHYAPDLGRWLSRDPIGYVDGMNLYEYARSNPTRFVDTFGLYICQDLCELGEAKDPRVVEVRLRGSQRFAKPSTIEAGVAAVQGAQIVQMISDVGGLAKLFANVHNIGVRCGRNIERMKDELGKLLGQEFIEFGFGEAISVDVDELVDALLGIDTALMDMEGVAVWVRVEWHECVLKRCCLVMFRNDWDKRNDWVRCAGPDDGIPSDNRRAIGQNTDDCISRMIDLLSGPGRGEQIQCGIDRENEHNRGTMPW